MEPDEVETGDGNHGTVRKEKRQQWRRPFAAAQTRTSRLLPVVRRRWWWLPGWTFAAITQLPALLAIAWLVPATGLLLAGRLLPLPMVIIFVPLAVALCYFAMRRVPVSWPQFGVSDDNPEAAEAQRPRVDVPVVALLVTVAIAAGFGVWQAVFGSQQLLSAGDPSAYLQYGYWIAGHGTARIPTSSVAFGAAGGGLVYSSPGFFVSGGSVTAGFMPGLPLVLAAGAWLSGLAGALLMPAVIGGCAVLSFGGLVGRLCGARWAPVGALVLAVSLPEVYASRTPLSEPLVQVLLFGGLCLYIDSLVVRRRVHAFTGAFGSVGTPGVSGVAGGTDGSGIFRVSGVFGLTGGSGGGLALAGLGGLALGLTVLASIGSLSILLPAFPVLAMLFVARRPQAGPFGAGLFLGIGIGLGAGLVLARSYLATEASQLHLFGLCAAGFGVLTALAAPLAFPSVRARVRRLFTHRAQIVGLSGDPVYLPSLGSVAQWVAVAVPVIALVGLAVRPYVQTVRGQTDPAMISEVAALQRIAGLPVDGTRQYYEQTLNWVLWYLGVPAVLMACAGTALLGRRSVRALLDWRASVLAARVWGLPFLIIVWSVATVLWDPFVAPWQPWASHRLVPVVLPGLVLLGVWVSSRLTARATAFGATRTTVGVVGVCCALALAIPPAVTTLNPGLAARATVGRYSSGLARFMSRVQFRGVGGSSTYAGSVAAANALCTAIGPSASVVFVDATTAANFEPVVRDVCEQPAASVPAGSSVSAIEQVVTSIERTGRRPVLLGATRDSVSLFGVVPRHVVTLHTSGDAQVLTGPPAGTWPVSYTVWMSSPLGT